MMKVYLEHIIASVRESRNPDQSGHRSESTPHFGKNDDSVYRWQILKKSCLENSDEWVRFDEIMTNTLRAADAMIDDKKKALRAAAEKEKFLRAEYIRMVTENELLLIRQSEKAEKHLKIAE